jgi:hypothetical protein
MKSNRKLGIILALIIVVSLVGIGVLYFANDREIGKQAEMTDAIARNQAIISKGIADKKAKEAEAVELAQKFADAELLIEQAGFRASAESIEYDRILFSIANSTGLQVTSLTATPPLDMKEGDIIYQLTTYTVSVEGKTPGTIPRTPQDSTNYIATVVNNILAYANTVVASEDFDTAAMPYVNISVPEPMTQEEIDDLIEGVNGFVQADLEESETKDLTEDQIVALVQARLTAKTTEQIQLLLEKVGLNKPTAVITIKIWTYKGA